MLLYKYQEKNVFFWLLQQIKYLFYTSDTKIIEFQYDH